MIINPVYRKESRVTWKSFRSIVLLVLLNLLLSIFATMQINLENGRIAQLLQVDYRAFLSIFKRTMGINYAVLVILTPAMAASGISGERERRSFDLLLSTMMSPADLVFGKLCSCVINAFMPVVSALPIFSLVFLYGGIDFGDFLIILCSYFLSIYLFAGIGLFCSARCHKSSVANVLAYMLVIALFLFGFWFPPLNTFYTAVSRVSAHTEFWERMFSSQNVFTPQWSNTQSFIIGALLQFALGTAFALLAVYSIDPRRKK